MAGNLERPHYLRLLRTVAINIREKIARHSDLFVTHNFLSLFSEEEFDLAFRNVLDDPEACHLLSALRLVDCLPDKNLWESRLQEPGDEHWNILAKAVAYCFDHQSEKATDIRWIKLIFLVIIGRMLFGKPQAEFLEELRLYPDRGDMRKVRPMIRAAEIAARGHEFGENPNGDRKKIELPPPHQEEFWKELHSKTACMPDERIKNPERGPEAVTSVLIDVSEQLASTFHETIRHTGLDARHDSSFGLVFYALHALIESSASYSHTSALGRTALRTIVECFITLAYLRLKDDPALWLRYRDYGNGQTKLSLLKNLSSETVPRFVDLELLEALANEDKWLEFHDINLGAWSDKNLRTMATEVDLKDVYDVFYDLCSGYTHGHWTAIRDAAFSTCFNPLHRFHRIPRPINFGMRSILDDGVTLVNRMLDELQKLYPTIEFRISIPKQPDSASPSDKTDVSNGSMTAK